MFSADHDDLYPLVDQKGYHQSSPFAKFEDLRIEALSLCARAGCRIKYGHSEVGSFSKDGEDFEQHEIEFLPVEIDEWESADCLLAQREFFEKDGVFPAGVIENVVSKLKAFDDKGLSEKLYNRNEEISVLVRKFLHCS